MTQHPPVEILGVPIARLDARAALAEVERLADVAAPALVAYVNAHTLNLATRDHEYRRLLRSAALVLNDGAGVALAALMRGARFPENLNGSDFNPRILELAARRRWPVYFLGARPGVAARAAERMRARIPRLEVAGTRDGYFERDRDAEVAAAVRASGAAIVMVAMGNPLQERWLAANLGATGARLGVGVGAFFDFSAGVVPRAPAWMNRLGIEWVYRLYQEPRRMWRRYLVGNAEFVARAALDALRARRR